MRRLLLTVFLLALFSGVANAQVFRSTFNGQTTGTSATLGASVGTKNALSLIGISFNTNVCSTINTPTSWTKAYCHSQSASFSVAAFFQIDSNAGCIGPPNTCNQSPTFTWTGSSIATMWEVSIEGINVGSSFDTVSTSATGTGTAAATNGLTTSESLADLVTLWFTDNASSGITLTPTSNSAGQVATFNATSFDAFVTERKIKIIGSNSNGDSATLSASSDWDATALAFKPAIAPVGRFLGDAVPILGLTLGNAPQTYTPPNNTGNMRFVGTNSFDTSCGTSSVSCINGNNGVLNLAPGSGQVTNFWTGSLANIVMTVSALGLQAINGFVISSSGGTAPTATCSGGSTGVLVENGNASCTANLTPFQCCTGASAGTCPGSTNNSGEMQTSSVASSNCTISWSASGFLVQSPKCGFFDVSGSTTPTSFARGVCNTSTCAFDFASATSKLVGWICL